MKSKKKFRRVNAYKAEILEKGQLVKSADGRFYKAHRMFKNAGVSIVRADTAATI